jgi:hypothetical protein
MFGSAGCVGGDEYRTRRDIGRACLWQQEGSGTLRVFATPGCFSGSDREISHNCAVERDGVTLRVHSTSSWVKPHGGETDDCVTVEAECSVDGVEPGTYQVGHSTTLQTNQPEWGYERLAHIGPAESSGPVIPVMARCLLVPKSMTLRSRLAGFGSCALVVVACGGTTGGESGAASAGSGGSGGQLPAGSGGQAGAPSDCVSPESYARAYEPGAQGCSCGFGNQGVCVGGAALICQDGAWQAVEDGPCMPTVEPCVGAYATASDCLAEFDTCLESGGTFCGENARPCPGGQMVTAAAQCMVGDAFCVELSGGRWCTGPTSPDCPAGTEPMPPTGVCGSGSWWCFPLIGGRLCQLSTLTLAACAALGGEGVSDPGDGSLMDAGCSDRATLGTIDAADAGWDEGGLCCK